MDKGIFIKDIVPGMKVRGMFCVASSSLRSTRAGVPYLAFSLMDSTGSMEARIWDDAERISSVFAVGDYVTVDADAQEFNEKCQLKVNNLERVGQDQEVDPALFLPLAPINREVAWQTCRRAMKSIKNPEYARILKEIFSDRKTTSDFCNAPAAKKMHHACIGGLLQHSVNLLRLSEAICKLYPHLDRDLMVTASICHDLGKTREFSWQRPPIDYSDQGRLLGHIVMGLQMLDSAIKGARLNEKSRSILALKHVIASHHGQKEFGSPVLPMTEEAVVFHMIDDLDAKLEFLNGLKKDGSEAGWTEFQRLFERYFFLEPKPEENGDVLQAFKNKDTGNRAGGRTPREPEIFPAQASLWEKAKELDREE